MAKKKDKPTLKATIESAAGRENGDSGTSSSLNLKGPAHDLNVKLRRKKGGDGYQVLAPGTPFHEIDLSEVSFLHPPPPPSAFGRLKSWVSKKRLLFPFAVTLGFALAAAVLAPLPPGTLDFELPDIDLTGLGAQWDNVISELNSRLDGTREWLKGRDFKSGLEAQEKGWEAEHPVVLFPGVISTGLESWSTSPESLSYFRQRLWGTSAMIRAIIADKTSWVKQLSLDPITGLDPPGVRVRPAQGLDAASQFIQGYWVWRPIIENLACINYDLNNLEMAAYDWRLSYYNLEVRDHYFSRVKAHIELLKKTQGKKTILTSHSMGGTVVFYFLKWVEAEGYGNGGPNWVEEHIEAFVNIAGTLLGVPKAMTAFLSGEMKDTVELNPAGAYALEKFFSRAERAALFRSWAGSASMWIKGGSAVWGNDTFAPDDPEGATDSHGRFFSFRKAHTPLDANAINADSASPNLTASDASAFVLAHTPTSWQKMMASNYSYGIERDIEQLERNNQDHTKWTNPLEARLPDAPSMSIYCLYGVGKPTERSYWYKEGAFAHDDLESDIDVGVCESDDCNSTAHTMNDLQLSRQSSIDWELNIDDAVPKVVKGVKLGEGDGTVSLLSLGAMCTEGWRREDRRYNPGGIRVVTHEFKHEPDAMELRGGARTGDHIDVLGSAPLNEAVLRIASGRGHELQDHFVSDILRIAKRIQWDE